MNSGTETFYFYRLLHKPAFLQTFVPKYEEKDFIFLRTDVVDGYTAAFVDGEFQLVSSYNENEVILRNCRKLYGYVIEYCFPFSKVNDYEPYWYYFGSHRMYEIIWHKKNLNEYSQILSKTKTGFAKYLDIIASRRRKRAVLDANGDSKDFFYARLFLDWEKFEFEVDTMQFVRTSWTETSSKPDCNHICMRFKFGVGKIYGSTNSDKILFSKSVYNFIMTKILLMRNVWAKRKLGLVCAANGVEAFHNITQYPYEPNLAVVADLLPQEVASRLKNDTPLGFSMFCSEFGIQNTRTLRKAFAKDPSVLVKAYVFTIAGFKDINIINRMLYAYCLDFIPDLQDAFVYFATEALKLRSEKSVCTLLLHLKNYYMKDTLNMFFLYREFVGEDLRAELFNDGFTEYIHNALSKISSRVSRQDLKISYSGKEKKYVCKIDDYNFCLPKSTGEIRRLGSAFSNCVASYADKAFAKACVIAYVTRNDSYELCIEIRKNKVCQASGKGNSIMKDEQRIPFEKWLLKNNLEYQK